MNETYLNSSICDSELRITGYDLIRHDRAAAEGKQGGVGVMIYYKNDHTVVPLADSCYCSPNLEACFIKLHLTNCKKTYVGSIYRSPDSSTKDSLIELDSLLKNLEQCQYRSLKVQL